MWSPPLLTKLGVWTDLNKYMGTFEEIQFVFSEEIQFVFFWTKSCFQTAPNQPVRGGGGNFLGYGTIQMGTSA